MIPKILHLAWIGDATTRPDACIESWRRLNQDYEVRVWGNEELSSGQWTTHSQMKTLLGRDLRAVTECLRYEVLWQFGGVAVDALSLAERPIPPWLIEDEAFALWEDELDAPGVLSTSLLGAIPAHPLMGHLLDEISWSVGLDSLDPLAVVGASRLTQAWRESRQRLTVHPSHYLPVTRGEQRSYEGSGFVLGELLRPASEAPVTADSATPPVGEAPEPPCGEVGMPLSAPPGTQPRGAAAEVDAMLDAIRALGGEPTTQDQPTQEDTMTQPNASSPVESRSTLADLAKHIKELSADVDVAGLARKRFRFVLATDWSSATLPLTVLKAYAQMFPTDAPVDLVFAVPEEPTQADLLAVQTIFEGLGEGADTSGLLLESFSEASQKACYGAVIPTGDQEALMVELGAALTAMHHLSLTVRDADKLAEEPQPVDGFNAGLAARLTGFCSVAA